MTPRQTIKQLLASIPSAPKKTKKQVAHELATLGISTFTPPRYRRKTWHTEAFPINP
jgi:hypothetical protein